MQNTFSTIVLETDDENEIQYLEFKYLQTLLKKILLNHQSLEISKLDNTLTNIYHNYQNMKTKLSNNPQQSETSTNQHNLEIQSLKEMIIQHMEQKNTLIQKLNSANQSHKLVLVQNETLYQTISKYEEINQALSENVEILTQSLEKQKQLYNLQVEGYKTRQEHQKVTRNETNQDVTDILVETEKLIKENEMIKKKNIELKEKAMHVKSLEARVKLLLYLVWGGEGNQVAKQGLERCFSNEYVDLVDFGDNVVLEEIRAAFPNIQQETIQNITTAIPNNNP